MPSKVELLDELQELSSRISETTRTVSLGVLALAWLFLAGGADTPVLRSAPDKDMLVVSAFCVLLSLFTDYLQYLAGYLNTMSVFAKMEKTGQEAAQFERSDRLYRMRGFLFILKQVLAFLSLLALFLALRSSI